MTAQTCNCGISNHEQLAICIRWVDRCYEVHEDLIGMVHVESTTLNSLTAAIKDVLICCVLPLHQCRGQAYDGAANMMGHLTGVAKQLLSEEPGAVPVHCLAHSLNLCLQDVAKKCQPIRNALNVVMELSQLIGYLPKRTLVFQQCKQQSAIGGSGLRPICPTRWTVRTAAINAVLNNYAALKQALQIIGESSYDDYRRRASGLLALMDNYDTYFGLKLSYLIFSGTEQTSINLQMKDTSVQEALSGAELAKSYLQRMRSDNSFQQFYASVTREAEEYTEEPTLPRYRLAPRELDGGSEPHRFSSPQDYYKPQYFEAIDLVVAEISARFDQKTILLLKEIATLIIKASNCVHNTEIAIPESILKLYSKDIDKG